MRIDSSYLCRGVHFIIPFYARTFRPRIPPLNFLSVYVSIRPDGVIGRQPHTRGTDSVTIPLGSLQTGQTADIIVRVTVAKGMCPELHGSDHIGRSGIGPLRLHRSISGWGFLTDYSHRSVMFNPSSIALSTTDAGTRAPKFFPVLSATLTYTNNASKTYQNIWETDSASMDVVVDERYLDEGVRNDGQHFVAERRRQRTVLVASKGPLIERAEGGGVCLAGEGFTEGQWSSILGFLLTECLC